MPQSKVTIKIPRQLYSHLGVLIEDSGFNSVTEFIVYVLRDIACEKRSDETEFSARELQDIKSKLEKLGYL